MCSTNQVRKPLERPYSHFFCSHCHILDNKITTFENKSIALQRQHFHLFQNHVVEDLDMNLCMHRIWCMVNVVPCKNNFSFYMDRQIYINSSTCFGAKSHSLSSRTGIKLIFNVVFFPSKLENKYTY